MLTGRAKEQNLLESALRDDHSHFIAVYGRRRVGKTYLIMKDRPSDEHFWTNQINTPALNAWAGLAFERMCLLHVEKIKERLGISGVHTDVNA